MVLIRKEERAGYVLLPAVFLPTRALKTILLQRGGNPTLGSARMSVLNVMPTLPIR